jgi:hypothetical protein
MDASQLQQYRAAPFLAKVTDQTTASNYGTCERQRALRQLLQPATRPTHDIPQLTNPHCNIDATRAALCRSNHLTFPFLTVHNCDSWRLPQYGTDNNFSKK